MTTAFARTTTHVAARSRAHGPTAALWHAVEVHRHPSEVDGACELTLCGSLARISVERAWPVAERDVCVSCVVLSR
jgi:hypothetical protein